MKFQNTTNIYDDQNVSTQDIDYSFLGRVYGLVALSILLTVITAIIAITGGLAIKLMVSPFLFFGLIILQFGLVISLSAKLKQLSTGAAMAMLLAYAAITGITISWIAFAYDLAGIISAFAGAVIMFLVMAVLGFVLKKDLTKVGTLAVAGLIGIIFASLFNFLLGFFGLYSESISWIITIVGVLIFLVLIAWDTQKLKVLAGNATVNKEEKNKYAVVGALSLYLDFINLFLMLLRIFGRR